MMNEDQETTPLGITAVKELNILRVENEDIEPYILIDVVGDKPRVIVNKKKLFRTLAAAPVIPQVVNNLLVNLVNEHLEGKAKAEAEFEQQLKDRNIR